MRVWLPSARGEVVTDHVPSLARLDEILSSHHAPALLAVVVPTLTSSTNTSIRLLAGAVPATPGVLCSVVKSPATPVSLISPVIVGAVVGAVVSMAMARPADAADSLPAASV